MGWFSLLSSWVLLNCNVPAPPSTTGGTDVPLGPCGRGVVVLGTDYQSTNVSLMGLSGEVLSSSFISSAASPPELSAALSGDVAIPSATNLSAEVVLIDRYPAAVLTWIAIATGQVRGQLNVGTGFAANPQDYLGISTDKAYVSRFETNSTPGNEPFDQGGDVLIIDPVARSIVGRIDLTTALSDAGASYLPRPNRMAEVNGVAYVLLAAYSVDFTTSAPSRLVAIDTTSDAVIDVIVLAGMHGCAGLAVSPSNEQLAVLCSGNFAGSSTPKLDESGVVLFDLSPELASAGQGASATESHRIMAAELVGQPLGFSLDFFAESRLVLVAMGRFAEGSTPAQQDALLELDLNTGLHRELVRTVATPYELGDVRCTRPCDYCFAADADRAVVHRLSETADGLLVDQSIVADTEIGLPPRALGRF